MNFNFGKSQTSLGGGQLGGFTQTPQLGGGIGTGTQMFGGTTSMGTTGQTPGSSMFPNTSMSFGTSTTTPQTGGMQTTSTFGGIGGQQGGLFNQPQTGQTGPQTTTQTNMFTSGGTSSLGPLITTQPQGQLFPSNQYTSMTSKPITTGGFQTQQTGGPYQQGYQHIQTQSTQYQSPHPVFNLSPNNFTKFDKVDLLDEGFKNIIRQVETSFKNNDVILDYTTELIKSLETNYQTLTTEGVKVVKFCKLINSKKNKINFITQTLKNEIGLHNDLLDKEKRTYHLLQDHRSINIIVPSEYFLNLTREVEDKINSQILQISDLEALVDLHYRRNVGSFKIDSDLVEETIKEIYNCIIALVDEAAKINDYVNQLKQSYVEMMKNYYGWSDYEVNNRIRHKMMLAEEEENSNVMKNH